jgi:hypothetical protein
MAAPATQQRFIRRGVSRIYYLKTVATPASGPLRAEITAGYEVTTILAGIAGFLLNSAFVPTPDMGSRFDSVIPGAKTVDDSSMRLYDDLATEWIETTFPVDDNGFVYFQRKGNTPTKATSDLFPVRVASVAPNWTTDMAPADVTINFAITSLPYLNLTIPA